MFGCDFSSFDLPADVYADGIGGVENLGENFRTIYFVFTRADGGILRKIPVLCVVRPQSSILQRNGAIARLLRGEGDPRVMPREARLHS